ncbi:MAG: hypothetical protein ACXVXB_06905 [Nocardioidaceae bacterium]
MGGTSGLSVMPFAVGSATSSVLAGRVVHRRGRWVTVSGQLVVTAGFLALAVAVPRPCRTTRRWSRWCRCSWPGSAAAR